MGLIDHLIEAVNNHYHNHGQWPRVVISKDFGEDHANDIAKLSKDDVEIKVKDHLHFRTFYLGSGGEEEQDIDTLEDFKRIVDQMMSDGKGHWPVGAMLPDASVFFPIHLFSIIPGQDPEEQNWGHEGLAGNPQQEYIRVVIGGITGINLRLKSRLKKPIGMPGNTR